MKNYALILGLCFFLLSPETFANRCQLTFGTANDLLVEKDPKRLVRQYQRAQARSIKSFLRYLTSFETMLSEPDLTNAQRQHTLDAFFDIVVHLLRSENISYFMPAELEHLKRIFKDISSHPSFQVEMSDSPYIERKPLYYMSPDIASDRESRADNFYVTYAENMYERFRRFYNKAMTKRLADFEATTPQGLWNEFQIQMLTTEPVFFSPEDYRDIARLIVKRFPDQNPFAVISEGITSKGDHWWARQQKPSSEQEAHNSRQLSRSMTRLSLYDTFIVFKIFNTTRPSNHDIEAWISFGH